MSMEEFLINTSWYWYIIIYIIGFILSLFFYKIFGKRLDLDYSSKNHNYKSDWGDYWDSNTQAYTAFSLAWFFIIPIMFIFGMWKILIFLTGKIIKD